jgi:hypothetical protein
MNDIVFGWVDDLALGRAFSFSLCLGANTGGTDQPNRFRHRLGNGSFVPCTTLGECSTDSPMQIKNGR